MSPLVSGAPAVLGAAMLGITAIAAAVRATRVVKDFIVMRMDKVMRITTALDVCCKMSCRRAFVCVGTEGKRWCEGFNVLRAKGAPIYRKVGTVLIPYRNFPTLSLRATISYLEHDPIANQSSTIHDNAMMQPKRIHSGAFLTHFIAWPDFDLVLGNTQGANHPSIMHIGGQRYAPYMALQEI